MDADQLAETTMDPRHRTLRRVTIGDAEAAEQVFELLMGSDVAPRRDFIVGGALSRRSKRHRRLRPLRALQVPSPLRGAPFRVDLTLKRNPQ